MSTQRFFIPENLIAIESHEIFVFGSNQAGRHGAGAAKTALDRFGAVYGEGEGLFGQSYALPTLDKNFNKLDIITLKQGIQRFLRCVKETPEKEFLLTKVGCGLAGYSENYIIGVFAYAISYRDWSLEKELSNLIFPNYWKSKVINAIDTIKIYLEIQQQGEKPNDTTRNFQHSGRTFVNSKC